MSILPDSSLVALAVTCRYFADATVPSLCARSGKPFRTMYQLLSFISFLRPESSTPRWPFIKELHFAREITEASSFFRGRDWFGGKKELLERIVEALHLCRHLRRLRLDTWAKKWEPRYFAQTLSMLSSLEELRMTLPPTIAEQEIRKLLRPRLRVFAELPGEGRESHQMLRNLSLLPVSLVELDLHTQSEWTVPPNIAFPHLRHLSIGYPRLETSPIDWPAIFPNLEHLVLAGPPHGVGISYLCSEGPLRHQTDHLREAYRLQWKRDESRSWPPLTYLRVTHPCTAYVLAVPRHIRRIAFSYESFFGRPALDMLYAVVAAAKPVYIDYHLRLYNDPMEDDDDALHSEFDILHGSTLLRYCVLTLESPAELAFDSVAEREDTLWVMLNALEACLQQSSLTHLLLRLTVPGLDRPHHQRVAEEYISMIQGCTEEITTAIAEASDTLKWIGIYVETQGLKSWGTRHPSQPDAGTTLVPMSTEDGWAVLAAEDTPDFAYVGHVPWRRSSADLDGA
ncbi:hypothetical protein BV20DRAFT_1048214 [Pilatotrama ljubarskyi]|nr:hypothetical protein BV20DRAFT_1048214 [Pilatotrama ljubarskyi]